MRSPAKRLVSLQVLVFPQSFSFPEVLVLPRFYFPRGFRYPEVLDPPRVQFLRGLTGCFTGDGTKENDISQLEDPIERHTIWRMKANEFHFMLLRFIITYKIWMFKKKALLSMSINSSVDWGNLNRHLWKLIAAKRMKRLTFTTSRLKDLFKTFPSVILFLCLS